MEDSVINIKEVVGGMVMREDEDRSSRGVRIVKKVWKMCFMV
jgi:hypothetical protein